MYHFGLIPDYEPMYDWRPDYYAKKNMPCHHRADNTPELESKIAETKAVSDV